MFYVPMASHERLDFLWVLDLLEGEESLEEPFGYKEYAQMTHEKINAEIYWD